METISGVSNWNLTIERTSGGIAVIRAITCDAKAVLPDTLFNLPVVELGDHALAANFREVEGENVRIVCGKTADDYNNRRITELVLPKKLEKIGRYAFADCVSLHTLEMHDDIRNIGAGSFMNCRSLSCLKVHREGDIQGPAVSEIVSELTRELEVRIMEADGEARFIFPEYYEIRLENEPTHFFSYAIEGAGYPYHSVFRKKQFSARSFDELWSRYISSDFSEETAVRLAWARLRYPVDLAEKSRERYVSFLESRTAQLADIVLGGRDAAGLQLMFECCPITQESLEYARSRASELGFGEAVAVILEEKHKRFRGGRERNYEL